MKVLNNFMYSLNSFWISIN